MALHWNANKVENWEEVSEGFEWDITQALIFATITIGINEITEANAEEVFVRLKMSETIIGLPFYATDDDGDRTDVGWSYEMVRRRIGLATNAAELSKAKFHGRIIKQLRQSAESQIEETV